jgi:3-methyl-2-oxobutanoate hydroxymethyltransferase
MATKRISVVDLHQMKARGERMTLLTAYDCLFAGMVDEAGIDMILIGDSLGMVVMGYDSTIPVKLEDVIHHTQAVASAAKRPLLIADMPFGSYEASDEQAIRNAGRLIKEGGAQAVKVEGGNDLIRQRISSIIAAGIPVMAHLGLTPQTASLLGGYRVQGHEARAAQQIVEQARALEKMGAFALLFECIPTELAGLITAGSTVPTIGVGAGVECDGQGLVIYDLLGLYPTVPKHARQYCDLRKTVGEALAKFRTEVKECTFPGEENSSHMQATELANLS